MAITLSKYGCFRHRTRSIDVFALTGQECSRRTFYELILERRKEKLYREIVDRIKNPKRPIQKLILPFRADYSRIMWIFKCLVPALVARPFMIGHELHEIAIIVSLNLADGAEIKAEAGTTCSEV